MQEALRSIKARLSLYKKTPPNGLAIFCGYHLNEDGKERKLLIELEPILPLSHSVYKCDSQFHTEQLREQLQEGGKYGFIVIDGHGVSFHVLSASHRTTLYKWENVMLPKKHGRGGQSQNRFARIRDEKRFNYVSKVQLLTTHYFIDSQTNQPIVSSLVMAGCADFKHDLAKRLDPRLQKIVAAFVDTQYNGEAGFNQAIQLSQGVLKESQFLKEQKTLEAYFAEISNDGLFAYSSHDTMYALENGALSKLIVWDDLPDLRVELQNSSDPTMKKVLYGVEKELKLDEQVGWEVVRSDDLIDWILEHYQTFGSTLELVSSDSAVGHQFVEGFGGIGGFLRYPVEFPVKRSKFNGLDQQEPTSENDEDSYEFVF